MARLTLAGVLKIELPGHTARICDGGSIPVDGEQYASRDPLLGVPSAFESLTEGVGDEAPAGMITFLPPDSASASALNSATNSGARCRLSIAEVDADTGLPVGEVEQLADWIVDTTALRIGMEKRELETVFVSGGERIFQTDRGNVLSPGFHRGIHPGEAGLDNASAASVSVPWGAPSPARGTVAGGASYGGGGFSNRTPGRAMLA